MTKTIRVSEFVYRKLLKIKGEMMAKEEGFVSFSNVLKEILEKYEQI